MRVLGYVRVSTEEQAKSRAGVEAQRKAIAMSPSGVVGRWSRHLKMPATRLET